MKTNYCKYLSALLFVCVFIAPGVFTGVKLITGTCTTVSEHIYAEEGQEKENENTEDTRENELKEWYMTDHRSLTSASAHFTGLLKTLRAKNDLFKSSVYLSIPTPPPEALMNC